MIPQQPHPLRCATCKNACYWRGRINTGFTHDMGCPRHTYAVDYEQRVKDVIAELNRLYMFYHGSDSVYYEGLLDGYQKAISLLKEGEQK